MSLQEIVYKILYKLFDMVALFGLPLSILAWVTVFSGSMGMAFVLRSHNMEGKWKASFAVGSMALVAHLLDYYVTLRVSPDLSLEANPLWCIVVDKMGLKIELWSGLTGKIMLAILSFDGLVKSLLFHFSRTLCCIPSSSCYSLIVYQKINHSDNRISSV